MQYHAVGHRTVGLGERVCLILYAEHGEVLLAGVLQRALAVRSHPHYGALAYGEYLAVHLILSLAFQYYVQFLVRLVSVQKTAILTRYQRLERQLAASSTHSLSGKHLALYGDLRSHREHVLYYLTHLSHVRCGEILAALNLLNLFHNALKFYCSFVFVLLMQSYIEKTVCAIRHREVCKLPKSRNWMFAEFGENAFNLD